MNDNTTQKSFDDDNKATVQNVSGQEYEVINGVACPIDPFEREMCDSCQ